MKTFFEKYRITLLLFIMTFIFITLIIQYFRIESLNYRIDTVNKNFQRLVLKDSSLVKDVKFYQFKEDTYIRQLDRDTNLTLWFVAVIFGLFGLISFSSFNRRIEDLEKELKLNYENHLLKSDSLKDGLLEIKADLDSESYTINTDKAYNFYKDKNYNLYVFYELLGCIKLTESYLYHKTKNAELAQSFLTSIKTNTSIIHSRIKDLQEKPEIDKSTYHMFDNKIRKVNDVEVSENLSKIHLLLKYT